MPGKTIWMIAMDCCLPEDGPHNRHFWLAKHLAARGYRVVVLVASKERGSSVQKIQDKRPILTTRTNGFAFVYIRIPDYGESMRRRMRAIIEFHLRLFFHTNQLAEELGRPDVILGSSGYPVSPWLANRLARRFHAASICEIRDLWPLSLEEYGIIKRGGIIARVMYMLEKNNYEKAAAIVFSMEGGRDYIRDKRWDTENGGNINLAKVFYINNGVDIDVFKADLENSKKSHLVERSSEGKARAVYAGSMRTVNNVQYMIDVADIMRSDDIEFVMVGGGDRLDGLRAMAKEKGLNNLVFTGAVSKHDVPGFLESADLLLMAFSPHNGVAKYGMSPNKLFEYLASGKPILSNLPPSYSIINGYECGIEGSFPDPLAFATKIREMLGDKRSMVKWGNNSSRAASFFSYDRLAGKLATIVESVAR